MEHPVTKHDIMSRSQDIEFHWPDDPSKKKSSHIFKKIKRLQLIINLINNLLFFLVFKNALTNDIIHCSTVSDVISVGLV
jgi:hypothetical protein